MVKMTTEEEEMGESQKKIYNASGLLHYGPHIMMSSSNNG